ncbi:MAG: TonB-dependent receptor [Planctomycetes bacterium]|nr:TonB-dependent receptor [Planctomycetota bacterium]
MQANPKHRPGVERARSPGNPPEHPDSAAPGPDRTLSGVVVEGRAESLLGIADSAGEGQVGAAELRRRPLLRPGEVLETVPGLIATQHSGAGKANQFFLRGFNLDHGTDLRTTVAGVPQNLPSHGHGQGYTDLGFLIPELIDRVSFRKGPYAARDGDFSAAGAVDIDYVRELDRGIARITAGSYDFGRALVADSVTALGGTLLFGAELQNNDGRWQVPEAFHKHNGVLRFSRGDERDGFDVTAMGYRADWTATDQVPARAVAAGTLHRFGSLDPTSGGESARYSLAVRGTRTRGDTRTRVGAYGAYHELDLFSNFTYSLDDPSNGDQFEQTDRRWVGGLDAEQRWLPRLGGREVEASVGVQVRSDFITNGLFRDARRMRLQTVRRDRIDETSFGLWVEGKAQLHDKLRATAGARVDHYLFDVHSDNPANSGNDRATLFSPRAGIAFGPFASTELYLNGGFGFHSNDARGVTSRDDPATPAPLDGMRVTPLVRARGAELGLRTTALAGLQSTVSLWYLDSDSELIFVGDAGNTQASRASERWGIEFANHYQPCRWLLLDADAAVSRALFQDQDPAGRHVPNAVGLTANAGITLLGAHGFASLRMRHFGRRSLIEDDSVRSSATTLFNLRLGCALSDATNLSLDVLNLFDAKDQDIAYSYTSRLAGEPAGGVADVHFHPVEPFMLRLTFEARF